MRARGNGGIERTGYETEWGGTTTAGCCQQTAGSCDHTEGDGGSASPLVATTDGARLPLAGARMLMRLSGCAAWMSASSPCHAAHERAAHSSGVCAQTTDLGLNDERGPEGAAHCWRARLHTNASGGGSGRGACGRPTSSWPCESTQPCLCAKSRGSVPLLAARGP